MTVPLSNSIVNNSVDRATFEDFYEGKAPWDIGKPQGPFAAGADRVTGPVLDAGCGTGEHALFFATRGHATRRDDSGRPQESPNRSQILPRNRRTTAPTIAQE